jgi:hypothetical protein
VISWLRTLASPAVSTVYPDATVTLPAGVVVASPLPSGRRPPASPDQTRPVAGSVTRKTSGPVVGSPLVATVSVYSAEPGTCVTEAVWMATMASALLPR